MRHKEIVYDANGNQTEIKEKLGDVETSLRKNLWDEENRLIGVDLKPDDKTMHPIAVYTYDAAGQRAIRYNYDHIDVYSNADQKVQGKADNIMLYPSGLLMGSKAVYKEDVPNNANYNHVEYTKHYYIGSERVSTKTGTMRVLPKLSMGMFPEYTLDGTVQPAVVTDIRDKSNAKVTAAGSFISMVFTSFAQTPPALNPIIESTITATHKHDQDKLNIYYFHPDHLGSSSYITDMAGNVSQHIGQSD